MKFLSIPLLLVLSIASTDWPLAVKDISKKVARLEMQKGEDAGTCSGVVWNATEGVLVTCAHCVEGYKDGDFSFTVNGGNAEVVKYNAVLDLAAVKFDAEDEEAMLPADEVPPMGTEVGIIGFGFGVAKLAVQFGRISQPYNDETKRVWVNGDILFGDSGGALIDATGKLVGINSSIYSAGPAHLGGAIPIGVVKKFMEQFNPKH